MEFSGASGFQGGVWFPLVSLFLAKKIPKISLFDLYSLSKCSPINYYFKMADKCSKTGPCVISQVQNPRARTAPSQGLRTIGYVVCTCAKQPIRTVSLSANRNHPSQNDEIFAPRERTNNTRLFFFQTQSANFIYCQIHNPAASAPLSSSRKQIIKHEGEKKNLQQTATRGVSSA